MEKLFSSHERVFYFNVISTDLNKKILSAARKTDMKPGLFDLTEPLNKTDLDRMEELYLRYRFKQINFTLGRQFISTPFFNKQDGRMRPTVTEAIE